MPSRRSFCGNKSDVSNPNTPSLASPAHTKTNPFQTLLHRSSNNGYPDAIGHGTVAQSAVTLARLLEDVSENVTGSTATVASWLVTQADLSLVLLASHPLYRAAVWVYKVPLVALGVFGNTMTLIIERRMGRGSGSAMSVFISSVAVSDSAMLLFLGTSIYFYSFDIAIMAFHDVLCKLFYWLLYVLAPTSAWILVAMTLQRAASILWPHRVSSAWSARKARITVLVIVVTLMILNSHILYGRRLQSLPSGQTVCVFVSEDYRQFSNRVWPCVDIAVSSLVPFVLVISANVVLVKRVRQAMKEARQTLAAGSTDQLKVRQQKTSRMTLTLVCVSVAFLVLTSPICLFFVLQRTASHAIAADVNEAAFNFFFEATGTILWLANNAINFYIYVLTGSRY